MIIVDDLYVSYGTQQILRGCSLEIPTGAHAALMGPSGCGKTTLLRALLGLTEPDSGAAAVRGRIACVFQEPRLLPWRTAAENVNAVLSDTPATLPQAREWLGRVELVDAAEARPAELSGGMQQRTAIARALACGGDVLLLDEPLKGLDAALRDEMLELLRAESAGRTLLLITHDEAEARALADTVCRMEHGRIKVF